MAALGINLGSVNYWTAEEPFIDRFLTTGLWQGIDSSGGNAINDPVPLDAQGNPLSIPGGKPSLATLFSIDTVSAAPTDRYVVTYEGTVGSITFSGAKVVSYEPGRIVIEGVDGMGGFVQMKVHGMSASDPISEVHVVRADQVSLFEAGEIFNPAFVEKVSEWGIFRTMDWGNTNAALPVSWETRSTLDDASWATTNSADGVPIEALVRLANEAHVDLWYNVPAQADDTYVRNALTYMRDNLDPGLKVHVEYSNEVWNWAFATARYAQTQANALWGTDTNGDGKVEDVGRGNLLYYGYRSAEIASIAKSVFGAQADSRLVEVLAGQGGNLYALNDIVKGVQLANKGDVGALFSDYAITTYFGYQFGSASADQATVLGWARSGAAGMDAAFRELEVGGSLSSNFSLAVTADGYKAQATRATELGLDLVAYEGGSHMTAAAFDTAARAEILAFYAKLYADPRMGELYTKMATDFFAAGGTDLIVYNDVGTNTPNGFFGLLSDIYETGSPRYDAMMNLIAQGGTDYRGVNSTATQAVTGTAGPDILIVTPKPGVTLTQGLAGNDIITASTGDDIIEGGDGNDLIKGSSGSITALGWFNESDFYNGGGGNDTIVGGTGNDHIYGNSASAMAGAVDGDDSLLGGAGNDYVQGNAGVDTIDGGTGNDRLYGGAGNDIVSGGTGIDYVQGNRGNDVLSGGLDNDTVRGGADNDTVSGDAGDDLVMGDAGDDRLSGGGGIDLMIGGGGNDVFVFASRDAIFTKATSGPFVVDQITDFTNGLDHIQIANMSSLKVVQGSAATAQAALTWADQQLAAHAGQKYLAAVSVGTDTYLFYDMDGVGGSVDSAIRVSSVSATIFDTTDFI